ncbi:hypothetical protein [Burkholderia ubonensis]|nr:hypothetical protein [Burkholderia ubonensis]
MERFNNRDLRQRALRAMVGGLMVSSLTDNDLKRLVGDFDVEFLYELREYIMALPIKSQRFAPDIYRPKSDASELADLIYDQVRRRKLSKERVREYMRSIAPDLASEVSEFELPIREMIAKFVERAGSTVSNMLLVRSSGEIEQDSYLSGISRRK